MGLVGSWNCWNGWNGSLVRIFFKLSSLLIFEKFSIGVLKLFSYFINSRTKLESFLKPDA